MAEIVEVKRQGDWYFVKGRFRGRDVEVSVPAAREQREGRRAFERAVETVGRALEHGIHG